MGTAAVAEAMVEALERTGAGVIGAGASTPDDEAVVVRPPEHAGSRFEIGSITKAVTGTVLARLVLDGTTSLDAPISTWLDGGDNGSITLEQLATHTSGLPRLAPNHAHPGYRPADPYASYDAALAEAALRPSDRSSIGQFSYSNYGYQLLGLCIERVTGRPLPELFEEIVLRPAGMATATTDPADEVLQGTDDDGSPVDNWTLLLHGPGGINGRVDDLLRLATAVAGATDARLAEALAFATEARADGPGAAVGLGWLLHPAGIVCCGGGTAGFSTYVATHRAERGAVAIAVNRSASDLVQTVALAAAQGTDPRAAVTTAFEGDPAPWTAAALALFAAMRERDFEQARNLMRADTAQALTADRISAGWSAAAQAAGELGDPQVTDIGRHGGAIQVTLVATGADRPITMRVWLDPDRLVAGVTLQ